ncbi:hypothetical protein Anas_04592 [Armadillidium nasatum]|uniref:Uncharacterized protein n=1 Tax=Armadillidium nasatum TaxID=96803 RepID=A0A5N5SSR9_9CRUS|nr:hypothetical protein Anas_04592 [Armadillidium nasatum]
MEEASTTDREEVELTYATYLDNEKMKIVLPARAQLDPVQQAEIIDENFPLEYQGSLDHLISETQSCNCNISENF